MRHPLAYGRRQRAVTFIGPSRSLTISLPAEDFQRFEQIAIERDLPNSTLGREIILQYLARRAKGARRDS
jgi:hypothetical protein